MIKTVSCPTCGKAVQWSERERWRPFCSERCQLIDLGEWLGGMRRIPEQSADEREPPNSVLPRPRPD